MFSSRSPQQRGAALVAAVRNPEAPPALSIPQAHPLPAPHRGANAGPATLPRRVNAPANCWFSSGGSAGTTDKLTISKPALHSIAHVQGNVGKKNVIRQVPVWISPLYVRLWFVLTSP